MKKLSSTKDQKIAEALEEHLRFEELLSEVSAKLVSLSLDEIDVGIRDTLSRMLNFFDADRVHLTPYLPSDINPETEYFVFRKSFDFSTKNILSDAFKTYIHRSLITGETLIVKQLSDLPDELEQDCLALEKAGIKSIVFIPLKIDDEVRYSLILSTLQKYHPWEEHHIHHIQIIGNLLSQVLNRKIIIENMTEEKAWNEAFWEQIPQILYAFDDKGRLIRWNKNAERVFGYTEQEMKGRLAESFSDPAYHKRVAEAVQKVFTSGEEQIVETVYITKTGRSFPVYGNGKLVTINGKKYLIGLAVDVTELKQAQQKIKQQLKEIQKLKEQLEAENLYLRQELNIQHAFSEIIGESNILKYSLYRLEQVAPTDSTVLLEGETGTGKELFARALHQLSRRKNKPLITVNCAAIPANLFESELFGHVKGAFTGATSNKTGRFELANGGTLFLDEVSEMPLELQAKLLRVLQESEFERVGSTKPIKVDVRVIAATNKNLENEIKEGRFRKDLYYRLNVYPITIAPLRERLSDIPILVEHFVRRFNRKFGKNIETIPKKTIEQMQRYSWPGNVRELENIIERAVILSPSSTLFVEPLRESSFDHNNEFRPLNDMEREYIIKVLEHTYWRVDGPHGAARILDMHPETLRSRMRKLGIVRPRP